MRVWPAVLLLLLVPASAAAQAGFGVRVTNDGLDELATAALPRLPTALPAGPLDRTLYTCSDGDTISVTAPDVDVALTWHALDLESQDGALIVDVTTSVAVTAPGVRLDNVWGCAGFERCDLSASVANLQAIVSLGASTTPEGTIAFHGAMVDIEVAPTDVVFDSEACSIGDLAEWLFESVQHFAIDIIVPILEDKISEQVSTLLTDLFAETLGLTIEREALTVSAWLESLDLTQSQGVTVGGDASMTWTGPIVREGAAPDFPEAEGDALPWGFDGQVQLAASDRLVNQAIHEAWRGGLLQQLIDQRAIGFDLGASAITRQIGLDGGARLEIGIDLTQAPRASFGRVAANVTEIALEGLVIEVNVTPEGGPTSLVTIAVAGTVAARLQIDPVLGGLTLEVEELDIAELVIDTADDSLALDRARLARFVERTITPILSGALSGLPVAPALHGFEGTYVNLRAVESVGGWQRIGADVHTPDPTDATAPDTSFVDPRELYAAGTVTFPVTGTDDSTPEGLLRYRAWLDGAPLNEGEASSVRAIRVNVDQGDHVLEVAAVDLNGNEDATRAQHAFFVDGTPPSLALIDPPGGVYPDTQITVGWTMDDPEGFGVQARWEVRRLRDDGSTMVVAQAELGDRNQLSADGLEPGELYEIEVVAQDAAGNVTSQSVGFAVDPNAVGAGGCSVAAVGGLPAAPLGGFAVALLGLVALRRRRR